MSSAAISDINQINFQNVYQLLYQKGPLTQQDICRLANTSRPIKFMPEANTRKHMAGPPASIASTPMHAYQSAWK